MREQGFWGLTSSRTCSALRPWHIASFTSTVWKLAALFKCSLRLVRVHRKRRAVVRLRRSNSGHSVPQYVRQMETIQALVDDGFSENRLLSEHAIPETDLFLIFNIGMLKLSDRHQSEKKYCASLVFVVKRSCPLNSPQKAQVRLSPLPLV